ncbi:MAG: zinc metallopeptidase [Gemmatimonadota bacterium]|nr:zinc metallopeptidase [Gemmatimonadota bacterium]
MRWTPGGRSADLEDRRSSGGGGMGLPLGVGGTVVVLVLSLLTGHNFFNDVGGGDTGAAQQGAPLSAADSAGEEREVQFVSFILDDVQNTWAKILPREGVAFHRAKLAIFRNSTNTGCGMAQSAMGPFYCPLDEHAYIDLGFYEELKQKFGASGDMAQAYVLAHELGHHIQHLTGIDDQVRQRQDARPSEANQLSVRLELQADCYAGVWANSTSQRNILEQGDLQEALTAASAVGDDRIQQRVTGHINVDAFTHGSAAQRSQWFKRGFDSGDPKSCDTFAG